MLFWGGGGDIDMEKKDEQSAASKKIAILFMLMSALGFSLMNLFVRLSGEMPTTSKSFGRNLVAFLVAFIFLLVSVVKERRRNESKQLDLIVHSLKTPKTLGLLLMRSGLGLVGILCNFYALDHIQVAEASVLNKTAPFFVLIFSLIFLKEKLSIKQIVSILVAFLGVVLITNPLGVGVGKGTYFAYCIALFGGVAAGAAYTFVRLLGQVKVPGSLIICFFSAFSTLATLPSFLKNQSEMTSAQLLYLLLAGLFAAMGQYGITYAYRFAPARDVSIYDYFTVVFSALWSFIVLAEVPQWLALLGALLIFVAALINFMANRARLH